MRVDVVGFGVVRACLMERRGLSVMGETVSVW